MQYYLIGNLFPCVLNSYRKPFTIILKTVSPTSFGDQQQIQPSSGELHPAPFPGSYGEHQMCLFSCGSSWVSQGEYRKGLGGQELREPGISPASLWFYSLLHLHSSSYEGHSGLELVRHGPSLALRFTIPGGLWTFTLNFVKVMRLNSF